MFCAELALKPRLSPLSVHFYPILCFVFKFAFFLSFPTFITTDNFLRRVFGLLLLRTFILILFRFPAVGDFSEQKLANHRSLTTGQASFLAN
ncbi:hypothetical protein B0T26DRAFT_689193, partial [Lasiosphaeria miniovina]